MSLESKRHIWGDYEWPHQRLKIQVLKLVFYDLFTIVKGIMPKKCSKVLMVIIKIKKNLLFTSESCVESYCRCSPVFVLGKV